MGKTAAGVAVGMAGFASAQNLASTALRGTIGAAMDYEKALNVMQATSGATAAEMAQISARAKELGSDNTLAAVSASDAAEAMTELARAGLSVNDTMSAAKGVLQLATAGQLATADAAMITANALNAFGLSGSEATRVADMLAAAANASSADVADLGMGMSQASAVFHNAKQPIEALITAMTMMSNAGVQGSDAATSLKTAMLSLQAPVAKAQAVMDQYNINVRDAAGNMLPFREIVEEISTKLGGLSSAQQDAALKTIFGSDAIRAAQIVFMAGADAYDENAAAVGRVGAANELAAAQMKGAAGAIAAFQSELETIGLSLGEKVLPHIVTLMSGISGLLGVITMLPTPIKVATAALLAFGAAALVFAANPVVAALLSIGITLAFVTGKLEQAKAAQEALNAGLMGARVSAMETYAKALKGIADEGGGLAERQNFLRGQVSSLSIAYGKGNDELEMAVKKYNELEKAYGKNSVQAEAQKKIVTDLTQSQHNLAGSQQVARAAIEDGGAALMDQAEAATSAKRAVEESIGAVNQAGEVADEVSPSLQLLAGTLGITAEEAEKLKDPFEAAVKWIDELTGSATAAEMTWNRQTTALDSVATSAQAMTTSLDPESLATWAARAHEMVNQSEAAAPAIAAMHREIDIIAQGGPGAADALDRLNKIVDAAKAPYADATSATRAYADAQGAAAKEALGIGGALESLRGILEDFVNHFLVSMGRIPPAAQEAMRLTEEAVEIDLSKPGSELAISLANGFDKETVRIVDGAGNVIHEVKGALSGADMSPEGVGLMKKVAAAMEAGGVDVKAATIQVITDDIKATIGATELSPEAEAMIGSLAAGIASGSPTVTGNVDAIMAAITRIINGGEGAAASAGANFANAFALAILSGAPNVAAAAQTLASTAETNLGNSLGIHSPSTVGIFYGEHFGAGFSLGIRNSTGDVIAAAEHLSFEALAEVESAVNRFNRMVNAGGISVEDYEHDLSNLIDTVNTLHTGFGPILEDFSRAATIPYEAAGAIHTVITSMRQANIDTANLELRIAELNRELSYTDPYSDRAAAIKNDIQILESWRGQIQAGIDVLDAEAAALEANKTAWDGVLEAREKARTAKAAADRLGPGGADVSALLDAAMGPEATAQMGRDAVAGLDAFVDDLLAKGGPALQATADNLRFLFWASFNLDTPEARANAKGQFDNVMAGLNTDAVAAITVSTATINNALTNSLFDEATIQSLGEKTAGLRADIAHMLDVSGTPEAAQAMDNVTDFLAEFEATLAKLPASIRGPMTEEFRAAVQAWAAAPNDPAVIDNLLNVVSRSEQAMRLFPQNLDALRPEVREAAMRLYGEVGASHITLEEAIARLDAISQLIPQNFASLAPEVQAAALQLAHGVEQGLIPGEDAIARFQGFVDTIPDALADIDPRTRQILTRLANNFLDFGQDVHQASDTAANGLRQIEQAAASAASTANPALASIDRQIQALIASFQQGGISAEQFAASMNSLQAAAATAERVAAAGGGRGGGGGGGSGPDLSGMSQGDIISYALIFGPINAQLQGALLQYQQATLGATPEYASFLEGARASGAAQHGGEAQLGALVRRASNMGLAAEAHAIEQDYYSGRISLGEAISRLQALISGGGIEARAGRISSAAATLRGGDGGAAVVGGGSRGSGVAPIVSELQGSRQEIAAMRQELVLLRQDLTSGRVTARVSEREIGEAAMNHITQDQRGRF
ncbi:MAG: phage tail tape measure protein [Dehalococcoidia bacterium]